MSEEIDNKNNIHKNNINADSQDGNAAPTDQLEIVLDGSQSLNPTEQPNLLELTELDNAIECILFCTTSPLSPRQILSYIGAEATLGEVKKSINRLKEKYDQPTCGLMLDIFKHGVQLRTKPTYNRFLQNFMKKRPWRISQQAMEVLAIIAYRQPIHRAAIDEIRGTDSSHLLHTLNDKGLIHMVGKAESLPGKPLQYGTTDRFLEVFSLNTLTDLPSPKEMAREA